MNRIKELRSAALIAVMLGAYAHNALALSSKLYGAATITSGLPLPIGSTVAVIDSTGATQQVTTTKAGSYSISTTGLTAPLLIQGGTLFSYSLTGTGIANIDALTDLIVNQIYQAMGTTPLAQFATASSLSNGVPVTPQVLIPAQIITGEAVAREAFRQPFSALLKLEPFTGKLNATNAKDPTTQFLRGFTFSGLGTATETVDGTFGSVGYSASFWALPTKQGTWAQWIVNGSPAVSGSAYSVVYPSGSDVQPAYNSVLGTFSSLKAILKHEGKFLDYFNLQPVYSTNYFNGGKDFTVGPGFEASFLRTVKVLAITPGAITSFLHGSTDDIIGMDYYLTKIDNGLTVTDRKSAYFDYMIGGTGNALFYGDQLNGETRLKALWERDSLTPTISPAFGTLKVSGSAPMGTIGSISVSDHDGTFFSTSTNLTSLGTVDRPYKPIHSLPALDYFIDEWSLGHSVLPPAINYSDAFSFDLNLNPSGTQSYSRYLAGYSNETINLVSPSLTGTHTLSDFNLGKSLTVKWSPIQTFLPLRYDLRGFEYSATHTQKLQTSKPLGPTALSGMLKFGKMIGTEPVSDACWKLSAEGYFGQRTSLVYGTNSKCLLAFSQF